MKLSLSSTFIDNDAYQLVTGVLESVYQGTIPDTEVSCLISTREIGDNPTTNRILRCLERETKMPIMALSAKRFGRLRDASPGGKAAHDRELMGLIRETCGLLPEVNMMLGDMIVKGEEWCREVQSLNLHPDLPLAMGGVEGIYWQVIGEWVLRRCEEVGGMVHLATPTLDAGTAVAYFRLPSFGEVNGVFLGNLWRDLPEDKEELRELVVQQVGLKDKPTHPLFQALRRAEVNFEPLLVEVTLRMLAEGEIDLRENRVFDREGREFTSGLDLTDLVVGKNAVWQEREAGR